MLWKNRFHLFGFQVSFYFGLGRERKVLHFGFDNRCVDGLYLLFLDYDGTPLDFIQEEVRLLQERKNLGNAYLFKTKNGYHVVFLEKMVFGELLKCLEYSTCDRNYKEVPLSYARKVWVLRQSAKKDERIEFVGVMKAVCNKTRSLAHYRYLRSVMGVPESDFFPGGNFDGYEELTLGYYHIREKNN